jgi:hypothetical protein
MYAGHDGNVYKNTGSGWEKYNNGSNSWNSVNTQQAQEQAHQQAQNYEQQHPESQANMQQREQSFNQERSSGGTSSQNLNSECRTANEGPCRVPTTSVPVEVVPAGVGVADTVGVVMEAVDGVGVAAAVDDGADLQQYRHSRRDDRKLKNGDRKIRIGRRTSHEFTQ